tara:strand:+ start:1636 stop:2238 length:603 start_codon:yes stop_codon:yes gene_type:complete
MKKTVFCLFFLLACANNTSEKSRDTHVAEKETEEQASEEPLGIIASDDCQHINLGDKACNIRLYDQNGNVWDMYDHAGDVILLDFSAVWCGPCQMAGHYSQPIQDDYQNEGVQIVTILIDGPSGGAPPTDYDIDNWVREHNITTAPVLRGDRSLVDPTGIAGYPISAFPTYLYIDRNMQFYAGHTGYSDAVAREKIEEAL